jgi:CO/xanthine dehydrogenase FAD-binding subunit
MTLPRFEYFAPERLDDALSILSQKGKGAFVMAGGTDLVMKMNRGLVKPAAIISLSRIKGLNKIGFDPGKGLTIGATALIAEVASHPEIKKRYPAIARAASVMANVQIRNMGTLAGNLCNAAPSADSAPPLMAMGADVTLAGMKGERQIHVEELFRGPGITVLKPGEIMTSIFIPPPPPHSGASYERISARGKVDIAAVSVCVMLIMKDGTCKQARIVLGAVAPVPMRARKAENILIGKRLTQGLIAKAAEQAARESMPISDVRASAAYRNRMVSVLTGRAIEKAHAVARKRKK